MDARFEKTLSSLFAARRPRVEPRQERAAALRALAPHRRLERLELPQRAVAELRRDAFARGVLRRVAVVEARVQLPYVDLRQPQRLERRERVQPPRAALVVALRVPSGVS